MSDKKCLLRSLPLREIDGALNVIDTIGEYFVRRAREMRFADFFLVRPSEPAYLIVPSVIKNEYGSLRIHELLNNGEFAEHRAPKAMHPNNYAFRPLRAEP